MTQGVFLLSSNSYEWQMNEPMMLEKKTKNYSFSLLEKFKMPLQQKKKSYTWCSYLYFLERKIQNQHNTDGTQGEKKILCLEQRKKTIKNALYFVPFSLSFSSAISGTPLKFWVFLF